MYRVILILLLLLSSNRAVFSQINIWEGTSCSKNVQLYPYVASGGSNIAVIICPGGSYFWHDMENEGTEVAKWLQMSGISAFVLNYRTAYVPAFVPAGTVYLRVITFAPSAAATPAPLPSPNANSFLLFTIFDL